MVFVRARNKKALFCLILSKVYKGPFPRVVWITMGVKRLVVPVSSLGEAVYNLSQRYQNIMVFLPHSPEHVKAGLREDVALIRAWLKKKGCEEK